MAFPVTQGQALIANVALDYFGPAMSLRCTFTLHTGTTEVAMGSEFQGVGQSIEGQLVQFSPLIWRERIAELAPGIYSARIGLADHATGIELSPVWGAWLSSAIEIISSAPPVPPPTVTNLQISFTVQ